MPRTAAAALPAIPVTFFTRQGCHLCEDTLALLQRLAPEIRFYIEEVDIETDPALFNRYWDRIPVVQIGNQTLELPKLNEITLRETLAIERSRTS